MKTLETIKPKKIEFTINMGIICESLKEYHNLLKILKNLNFDWKHKVIKELEDTYWRVNEKNTVIHFDNNYIEYSSVDWCNSKKIDCITFKDYLKCLKLDKK
jgi:hypothetical protein